MASNKTNSSRRVTPGISFAHHSKACGVWERSFHLKVHYCSLVLRISSLLPPVKYFLISKILLPCCITNMPKRQHRIFIFKRITIHSHT